LDPARAATGAVDECRDRFGRRSHCIGAGRVPWLLAAWARYGDAWRFFVFPRGDGRIPVTEGARALEAIVASSVDRHGFESRRVRAWEK
jgi:hypothetical protein